MRSLGVAACCVALGCGGGEPAALVDGRSSAPPYDGPLTAAAAIDALECDGRRPSERVDEDYQDGLAQVRRAPETAFMQFVEHTGIGATTPVAGYRVERKDQRAALISYDVRDRTKVAFVLRDGVRDWNGDRGWAVVAWAKCDPSELPAKVTDELNIGVWEDASDRRVPVTRVRSYKGPEHCSWTRVTFLLVGPDVERADYYVRDPANELDGFGLDEFSRVPELPQGAKDTGWRRDGRRLWLARDAAYLVDLEDPDDIERWPAAPERIACA